MERHNPQPTLDHALRRTLAAWQVVRSWSGLGASAKLAWFALWHDVAGGMPQERLSLVPADVARQSGYADPGRAGRDALEELAAAKLIIIMHRPEKHVRRPDALVWLVTVRDPHDVVDEQLALLGERTVEVQTNLEFADGADHLAGDYAAARDAAADTARVVAFKPGHDARSYPVDPPADRTSRSAAASAGVSGPLPRDLTAANRPPTPAGKFARISPQVGPKTSEENLSQDLRPSLREGHPSRKRSEGLKVGGCGQNRANFAADRPRLDRAAEPGRLGDAFTGLAMTLGERSPAAQAIEVERWRSIVVGRFAEPKVDAAIVSRTAEALAVGDNGGIAAAKFHRMVDWVDRLQRSGQLREPRFAAIIGGLKKLFWESHLHWKTGKPR